MTDPQNTTDPLNPRDSERTLIAHLGSAAYRLANVLDQLPGSDFYSPAYGDVWDAARALRTAGETIEPVNLARHMHAAGTFRGHAAVVLNGDLLAGAGGYASPEHHARIVAEFAAARRILKFGLDVQRNAQRVGSGAELSEVVSRVHADFAGLDEATAPTDEMPKSWDTAFAEWQQINAEGAEHPPIYPTPWDNFNEATGGGLQGGRFYLIGGRPGDGKSTVTFNLAGHFGPERIPSLFISAEMSDHEVVARIVARGAAVDLRELVSYGMSQFTRREVDRFASTATGYPLWIESRPTALPRIKATARALKRKHGLAVLVVDYLQIVRSGNQFGNRQEEVAHISRELKALARELDIAVVAPVQLNRGPAARADARPVITDLRESGQLEQDADMVVLLHHPLEDDPHRPGQQMRTGDIEFIIAKNRHGQTTTVSLRWLGSYATISNPRR